MGRKGKGGVIKFTDRYRSNLATAHPTFGLLCIPQVACSTRGETPLGPRVLLQSDFPSSISSRMMRAIGSQLPATPYLPQELVDHIIDHLHDDRLTLNHCSLVSRAWLPTSRLHLFAKVSLTVSPANTLDPTELCKRLHRLLSTTPSLIPNIRELDICEGCPGQPQAGPHGAISMRSTTWVTTERTFPQLLKLLTHLQRVEFSAQSTLHWATLPPSLQGALRHVFGLPFLTYIRLKSWSFTSFGDLADLVACCHNLKGLALSATRVGTDAGELYSGPVVGPDSLGTEGSDGSDGELGTEVADETPRRCGLEFLTLDYVECGHLGHWLLSKQSTVDLKRLRELRVAHFHDVTAIERVLAATGSSLEHFHLKPGPWDGGLPFLRPNRSRLHLHHIC